MVDTIAALSGPGTSLLLVGPDCLPHHRGKHVRDFYGKLEAVGMEITDVLSDGPKAKRMKLSMASERGEINVINLAMRDTSLAVRLSMA